jgi:hypothetical protein
MLSEQLMNKIAELRACVIALKDHGTKASELVDMNNAINAIFNDCCRQAILTKNTDKIFFGVVVMPIIPAKEILSILMKSDKYIINQIYVELDSKLFNPMLDLTPDEITAIILHEVGMMVSDASPIEKVKADIDNYLYKKNEVIKLSDSVHYMELLSFGVRDSIRKTVSVFERAKGEWATDYDVDCEIDKDLDSAMVKINNNGYNYNGPIDNKFIFLSWVLRLYRKILTYRIPAIHTLKKGILLTASYLERKEMNNIIRRLERIDDDSLLTEANMLTSITNFFKDNAKKMKISGLKQYEDDYYQFKFEANNMETQDEAILLMHRINSRMSVIDDYLSTEEISKEDRNRWQTLYNNFNKLRAEIANSRIYQNKTRIYVNYGVDD